MVTLRVTAADSRSPFVVHRRGLTTTEQVALVGAARVAGLTECTAGWQGDHPARIVDVFAALTWDVGADEEAERGLVDAWTARATLDAGDAWAAPGAALVEAQGCTPFAHQVVGSVRLATWPGGILADAPGLGKTLQECMSWPAGVAVNVACPRNAVPTWLDEVARWRPDLTVRALKKRGSAVPAQPGEVLVGTLESLPAMGADLRAQVTTGARLVCDEAHALKGESQQAGRFLTWAAGVRAVRGQVDLLTGTPVLNADPNELWRLLHACGRAHDTLGPQADLPKLFSHNVEKIWVPKRRAGGKPVTVAAQAGGLAAITDETIDDAAARAGEYVDRVTWTGDHVAWVGPALAKAVLRRTKDHIATNMPPVIYQDLRVDVPRDVLQEYARADATRRVTAALDALAAALDDDADEDTIERLAANPAIATVRRYLAAAKATAAAPVLDELEAAGEPVLVFSSHVAPVIDLGQRPGWSCITGDTTAARRGCIRRDFQAGAWTAESAGRGREGFAAGVSLSIRAAAESLTLTRAAHVIFIDEDWVPGRNAQAVHRADRIGQTRPVTVLRIVANHPVDRRIADVLRAKRNFSNALLRAIENATPTKR